jgi:hypothetical protein
MVKFSRDEIIEILKGVGGHINLKVTGLIDGDEFYGVDVIKII